MRTGNIPFDLLLVRSLYTLAHALEEQFELSGQKHMAKYLEGTKLELGGFINNYDYDALVRRRAESSNG